MDKYDLIAKCEAIITRQIAHTTNPKVREYLHELTSILAEPGYGETYKIIQYSNCLILVNDDFQNEVNFKLYDDGMLLIGCFDANLELNDRKFVRISLDEDICYMGWNDHGIPRGDAEVAKLEYDSHGKPVRYQLNAGKSSSSEQNRKGRVVNNRGKGIVDRILHNETIGRLDYFISVVALLFAFGFAGNLIPLLGKNLGGIFAFAIMIAMIYGWYRLNKKRYLDLNYDASTAGTYAIVAILFSPLFLYLALAPTKIRTEQEAADDNTKEAIASEDARRALGRRCDSLDTKPSWYRITPGEQKEAARIRPGQNPHTTPSSDMSKTRKENEETAGEAQQRVEIEGTLKEVKSKIDEVNEALRSMNTMYEDEKDEASHYQSLANSAEDERLREEYQREADEHQQLADECKEGIEELKRSKSDLENARDELNRELSNLIANL